MVDLNNLVTPGIYAVYANNTNHRPTGVGFAGTVLVMTYGSDYFRVFQMYLSCGDNSNAAEFHVRHSYHSGGNRLWASWQKLL